MRPAPAPQLQLLECVESSVLPSCAAPSPSHAVVHRWRLNARHAMSVGTSRLPCPILAFIIPIPNQTQHVIFCHFRIACSPYLHVGGVEARCTGRARRFGYRRLPRVRPARSAVVAVAIVCCFALLVTRLARYDPDIDGAIAPRAAAKAKMQQEEAEREGQGDGSAVAAKDVGAMYVVMRERVAKMEARVDERLNQVRSHGGQLPVSCSAELQQVESMLAATLLPLAKSLDQLVQQTVDQV